MTFSKKLKCHSELTRWAGGRNKGERYLVTIDGKPGEALSDHAKMRRMEGEARGFGSVKVCARIGETAFNTSVFPGKTDGEWQLPVKASVRRAEEIVEGDKVSLELEY